MEIDPKSILQRAVFCDKNGRYMEAECLYEQGTDILMEIVDDEHDFTTKRVLYDRISQYLDRTKQIKMRLQKQLSRGDRVATINIVENSIGNSYRSLFSIYLNSSVRELLIEEANLNEDSHFKNLTIFLETLLKYCSNLKYIRIVTKPANKPTDINPATLLNKIEQDLRKCGVTVHTNMDENLQSSRIVLNNGFIIKSVRGLHFYKDLDFQYAIGTSDYDFRKCHSNEIDIWQTQAYKALNTSYIN